MEYIFETDNLYVRQFYSSDAKRLYEYHLDPKVKQWMPNESYEDIAEAEEAIDFFSDCVEKDQLPYVLAVVSKQTGELIGDTGINEVEGKPDEVEIGGLCLCGMAYELMTEFAVSAAEKLNNEYFYLNGYTNGILSYFPTKEEYDIGGYEVYWSLLIYFKSFNRVFPFDREEADRVVEFVTNQAEGQACSTCGEPRQTLRSTAEPSR